MPKSDTEKQDKPTSPTPDPTLMDEINLEGIKIELDRLRKQEKLTVRKAIELEMELQSARADRDMFRRRYLDAQAKLEQMTSTPYPVGVVEKVLKGNTERTVVRLLSGQTFVCKYDANLKIKEGDMVALHQRSMAVIEILPPMIDPNVSAMEMLERPAENYSIIGGLNDQLLEIREVIELSFTDPDAFKVFNITPPRGVLLHGSPGTGKTLIAKAVANATNAKFLYLAAPELVQKFIGEGARMVREIFKIARENAPVIIFIDEIDAIAAQRTNESQSGEREVNRTLMQLLAELDGFSLNEQIRIIAATNRIDILDPAILRPGRFDRIIELQIGRAHV